MTPEDVGSPDTAALSVAMTSSSRWLWQKLHPRPARAQWARFTKRTADVVHFVQRLWRLLNGQCLEQDIVAEYGCP
jgi:hypothetical protein